jgi:AmpD protein
MKIDLETYLLKQVTYLASPNCNDFPELADVNLLVIHCISLPEGQYGGNDVIALFTNELDALSNVDYVSLKGLKVSAHAFIRRDGSIIQFVPFNKRAWHAGVSSFEGQEGCNDFSIGIELEGTDKDEFTTAQYASLVEVTQALQVLYPAITMERIVGHSDIAPGRKSDPGTGFDWPNFRCSVASVQN